jgi:RNA-directed DNA polymerase
VEQKGTPSIAEFNFQGIANAINLEKAFSHVKKNKGAPGVDKVTIKMYEQKLEDNL